MTNQTNQTNQTSQTSQTSQKNNPTINEEFADELSALVDKLHSGEIIDISRKQRSVRVAKMVSAEPREIQIVQDGEETNILYYRC